MKLSLLRSMVPILAAALTACGVQDAGTTLDPSTELSESSDELSFTADTYVSIRRDERVCITIYPSPCGGYFVRDVNNPAGREVRVEKLDFSRARFDQATIDLVLKAPTEEVVLHGRLGALPSSGSVSTRRLQLLADEAYRGMPGSSAKGDFFKVKVLPLECVACDTFRASKLNTNVVTPFTELSVKSAAKTLVDQTWLEDRLIGHDAIVTGAIVPKPSTSTADRRQTQLDGTQVFVRLPERIGPCPLLRPPTCGPGLVPVFNRTPDRCYVPAGCVKPSPCPLYIPRCEAGYALVSWKAPPSGCDKYVCDPSWSVSKP